MDLTSLVFKVESSEVEAAFKAVEKLEASLKDLAAAQKSGAASTSSATAAELDSLKVLKAKHEALEAEQKAVLAGIRTEEKKEQQLKKNTKAEAEITAATTARVKAVKEVDESTAKSNAVLERQKNILGFMIEGYTRGQASILATAKATGILSDEVTELQTNLVTQRKLIGGDPFDKSISGLTSLRNKYQELQESVMQFNIQSGLTSKQSAELSRDKERLVIKMQIEGKTIKEINTALQEHNSEYVKLANTLNSLANEQKDFERAQRETGNAIRALVKEEEKMLSVLSSLGVEQSNGVSINEKAARSIANYEQNLKRAGITGEQAAQKLSLYKKQQLEVIAVEQKRQVQYLQRGLQPQIGDVVVSLAGGQNPLTVLLQQGDQIRGLIAQTGVEGEALRKAMQGALAGTVVSIKQTAGAMLSVLGGAIASTASGLSNLAFGPMKLMVASLNDMRNGTLTAAAALENLKESLAISSKVGILTLIAGLTALGVAFVQTMKEGTALSKALNLSGAQLGLTKKSAYEYALALNEAGIKTSTAIKVITEMAKVGNLGKDSINLITKAAVDLEKYGGVAIDETVKEFSKLKDKPVEALTDLAKATGLINPAIIAQVKYLQDQGKAAEASALAIKAYADATTQAANQLKQDLSPVELAWKGLTSSIGNAWDSFKTFVTNSPTLINEFKTIAYELSLPFEIIALVLDRLDKSKPRSVKEQEKLFGSLGPSAASQVGKPDEAQTKLNADLAKAQERLFSIQDKHASKDQQRTKNILEIREATLDYYRKLNPLLNENQVAEQASLKIKELIANMDSKTATKAKDKSITYQSPAGNEAQNLEKQYNSEINTAKKVYESQRKMAKANFDAGLTERAEYINEDLALLGAYEQKQLAAAKNFETENAKVFTDTIKQAIQNRDKALASTAGSEDGVAKRKQINEQYIQDLKNLGNNFETTQVKAKDAAEALAAFISQREVDAISAYGKAVEENLKAFEAFQKTQEDYLVNRDLERKLQDDINAASGAEVEALKAKAEEQKRWTAEISRTQEALRKAKDDFEAALDNPLASDKQIQASFDAVQKNYKISQDAIAQSRIAVENAASDAIVQYYKEAFDRIADGLADSIVTALFEGGKKGKTKLREVLVNELKKPITATITVAVKTLFSDVAKNALTSLTGNTLNSSAGTDSSTGLLSNLTSMFGGNSFGAGISNFASDIGAELMRNGFSNAGSGISSAFGGAAGYSNLAYGAAGIGGSLVGGLFGGQGSLGGSIGSSLGLALGGPIGAILGSLGGGLIGSLFGGGTPYNTGGVYSAKADGTGKRPTERTELSGLIQNLGKAGFEDFSKRGSEQLDTATKGLAEGLLTAVNPILKSFGKESVDAITVAFRANGKKATGNLDIDGVQTNFKTGTNDPTKAFGEFTNYAAGEIVKSLKAANLPDWVSDLLEALGDTPGVEALNTFSAMVKQVQEVTKVLNALPMQNLKTITASTAIELSKVAGGLDALASGINSYYENFFTTAEKNKVQTENLTKAFKALGYDVLPNTRAGFRNLIDGLDLTTENGRKTYVELLGLSEALSSILPPLEEATSTLESFREATDAAYSNLEKAVNTQKEYYSTLRDNAKASVDRLKGIFDLLSTNIRELYNQVQQTSGMSASAGRNLIASAARTGTIPNQDELTVAIASVRESLSEENYATRFEAERDALILAGQLTQIKKNAGINLTVAERQLKTAEDQLTALEAILVNAKKQIDQARGIDTSVKSVTQALKELTAAILGETASTGTTPAADPNAPGGSNGFVIGGTSPGNTGGTSSALTLGTKTADGKYTIEQPTLAGTFVVQARDDQQKRIEAASALYKQLDGQVSVKTALETFKAQGYSLLELGAAGGFAYSDLLKVSAQEGVPRFATGGFHSGGLRIVGDGGGPELEATGPSRIYSASQTRSMLSDEGTKAEIQALRSDLRAQASATAGIMQEMLKINKRWDSDGLPEVRAVA